MWDAQRLLAVGECFLGVRVDFDQQAIGAAGNGGFAKWGDPVSHAGTMRRVDDDRQWRTLLDGRHNRKCQSVADVRFKGADASFTEDHVGIAFSDNVLSRLEQFLQGGAPSTLEQDRFAGFSRGCEQAGVMHVARPDLQDVGVTRDQFGLVHTHHLGDDGQPRYFSSFRKGYGSVNDHTRLVAAGGALANANISIDDSGMITILEIKAKCRRLASERGLDLVMVDYLQLAEVDDDLVRHVHELWLWEFSPVTFGANPGAKISVVNSLKGINNETDELLEKVLHAMDGHCCGGCADGGSCDDETNSSASVETTLVDQGVLTLSSSILDRVRSGVSPEEKQALRGVLSMITRTLDPESKPAPVTQQSSEPSKSHDATLAALESLAQ